MMIQHIERIAKALGWKFQRGQQAWVDHNLYAMAYGQILTPYAEAAMIDWLHAAQFTVVLHPGGTVGIVGERGDGEASSLADAVLLALDWEAETQAEEARG